MDIITEQLSTHTGESLVDISMNSIKSAIEAQYPTEKPTPGLIPSQTKQELQRLFQEDQAERADEETFRKKIQRQDATGIDEDKLRRIRFAKLVASGSIDRFLGDSNIPNKDKASALGVAAWVLFQHSGDLGDLAIAIRLACEGLRYAGEDRESSNIKNSIDRYLIEYQLQRQNFTDPTSAVQIFGTNSYGDVQLPLAGAAEDLKRLFDQNPTIFAAKILTIFR